MTKSGQYTAPSRFEVSHQGMAELNSGRPPWSLVKELVQNAWDEAPEATLCTVSIKPHPKENATILTVKDDGPGFADVTDAWTLMRHTQKRTRPDKRGRFNLGEKELISIALEATVETVGHTVTFPRLGARTNQPNNRTRGTVITAVMPWGEQDRQELQRQLSRFRPTDCRLKVNGAEIPRRAPLGIRSAVLRTVLQEGPDQPMRDTRRRTDIHVLHPHDAEQRWLYEMGIPIQPIETQWDVDVQQKVPMPPQRDTVSESYLTDIYAEVLNQMHHDMEPHSFGAEWVKRALQDDRSQPQSVRAVVNGRYGEQVVLASPDRDANLRATEAGYEVVNPRSLSRTERDRFKADAGVSTAWALFGVEPSQPVTEPPLPGPESDFAEWVVAMAERCGIHATVLMIRDNAPDRLADCTADTDHPTIRFNTPMLGDDFFLPPYGQTRHLALLYHELAHAAARRAMEHGPRWGEAVAEVAAQISSPDMIAQ